MRDVPIPVDLDTHVVPVVWPDDGFQFRGRPHNPTLAVAVDTASMVTDRAIDLDLSALDDFRCSGLKRRVNVDAAVATRLTLKSQPEVKVPIRLLGRQVSLSYLAAMRLASSAGIQRLRSSLLGGRGIAAMAPTKGPFPI